MTLLKYAEFATLLLGALFVLTQMAVPLIRGTKMFPLFRRQRKLEGDLRNARQVALERGLARDVANARKKK